MLKGRKLTEEHKRKISETLKLRGIRPKFFLKGDKHPNWKGGICEGQRHFKNKDYQLFRSKVFERDNWTCQTCKGRGGEIKLEIHHIKGWKEYPELRFNINNGVTLCENCHQLLESKERKGKHTSPTTEFKKGTTWEQMYGEEYTKIRKEKLRKKLIGNNYAKGGN